ncbi:uncharacterized protein N7500_004386 [Penicillium coprophilum]|uniref:uncharacterized protein n=1 Tax=Penicillium coprophilum TaxID=36646 RepID=UPI002385E497|nr:uncharacterized protein N7500_004386 [Penicillium coprophilum]KAJ5162556.1 hypothetical protein N7500_004386 [Penicillium coprophilum]
MAVLKQTLLAALATTSLPQSSNSLYRSRPDLAPPRLNITIPATNPNGSEYVFIAPYSMGGTIERPGPYIYRKDGDLVWAGTGYYAGFVADFHPTIYHGKTVLQAFQGNMDSSHGEGFENDIATGELIFEWNALEHVDPSESLVTLDSTKANSGLSAAEAWDFFHINSLDKNAEGDYLVSSRHTSTIFKINGTDGSIIWRLGGKYPSFSQIGNWTFGFQHDARWQPQLNQPGTEVISFFDNSGDGTITFNELSRALVVQINRTDSTATVLRKATAPYDLQAQSQGNTQLLSDDRIFVNWGSEGAFTEFDADNRIIYHAFIQTGSVSYRGFLANWTATPKEIPALVALKTASDLVELYVSWNGDTETLAWRFYYVNEQKKTRIGEVDRDSFETAFTWEPKFELSSDATFVAEAIGVNGESLARTGLTATTVDIKVLA